MCSSLLGSRLPHLSSLLLMNTSYTNLTRASTTIRIRNLHFSPLFRNNNNSSSPWSSLTTPPGVNTNVRSTSNNDMAVLSAPVIEVQPLTFSSTLKKMLAPSRVAWFQKMHKESQSAFISDVGEVRDIHGVLDLLEKHPLESITVRDLVIALELVFLFIKGEQNAKSELSKLNNSVGMQKLWKLVRRKSRSMMTSELIDVVKVLNILGVPGTDKTLLITLKMLTKHANRMDLEDINYLGYLLGKFDANMRSPLTAALEVALPVVFESQIAFKVHTGELDKHKSQLLCDYLHYASKNNLSDETMRAIISALERQAGSLQPRNAMSIIWSLADAKSCDPCTADLLKACFKIAAENLDTYDHNTLSTAVTKSARNYVSNKADFFYDEDFIQAFCQRSLKPHTLNREHVLHSLRYLSIFRHINVDYMDRVGELVASRPSDVLNSDGLFFSLVRSYAGCNYKPENWEKIEALFINHPALTKDLGVQGISLAVDFLALEVFPEPLIHKIFSPHEFPVLEQFAQRSPLQTSYVLLLLLNAVKTLYPDYSGPLPPTSMINKWKEVAIQKNSARTVYPLKPALQTGYGGENYVMNGVYHNGLYIDHAIVMRKGGFPIAINPTSSAVELSEISKPAESDIVLVKLFFKEAYANNTSRLRGLHALEHRILERLGHPILTVDVERWSQLPDFEKIPYLMHRIRERTEKLQWNNSDVIPR